MSAAAAHSVLVSIDEPFVRFVSESWIEGIVRTVLEAERVPAAELGVLVTDDETVRELNREYAGEDESTDVLSFSLREGEGFAEPADGVLRLGEVIIAYPTAERQAREAGRSTEAEVREILENLLAGPETGPRTGKDIYDALHEFGMRYCGI